MSKKIMSLLLCITILLSAMTMSAFAVETGTDLYVYESLTSDYYANKISHPGTGVGLPDGVVDLENGNPNEGLSYAWSAVSYGDDVYIGLLDSAIYFTIISMAQSFNFTIEQLNALIDVLWKGEMHNGPLGQGCIVKINTKTNQTTIIDENNTRGYRAATVFKDKLYFVTTNSQPELLEIDPTTDEVNVVYKSDPIQDRTISTGIRALTVHENSLVFSTNTDNGPIMLKSNNPTLGQSSFELIGTNEDFLEYPGYHYSDGVFGGGVWEMVSYNGKLYICVVTGESTSENPETPFAIFTAEENNNGEWIYTPLVGKDGDGSKYPLGLGADRSIAATLYVYDDYLYIGGYNDPMTALPSALTQLDFRRIYQDLSAPVQLWRMDKEENFELVAGDNNELFPNAIGNMPSGFDSNLNQYVWRMSDYDGKLFVGTFDIGSLAYPLMQFTNGDVLNWTDEDIQELMYYIDVLLKAFEIDLTQPTMPIKESLSTGSQNILSQDDLDFIANNNNNETIEKLKLIKENLKIVENSIDNTVTDIITEEDKGSVYSTSATPDFENITQADLYSYLLMIQQLLMSMGSEIPAELMALLDNLLAPENLQNFEYFIGTCEYLSVGERGFSLLVTENGKDFEIITNDGFGDPNNHGIRSFAKADTGLVIGTANPFKGTQIWQLFENEQEYSKGDVDKNGQVSIQDVLILQRYLSDFDTFDETQKELADLDGNGTLTILDVLTLQKVIANIIL